jgi:hypothetical protein
VCRCGAPLGQRRYGGKAPASAGWEARGQMEAKKPYVKPELEELGAIHDVTGGIFDIGSIFDIFGWKPGTKPGKGSS